MTNKLKGVSKHNRTRLIVVLSMLFVVIVTGITFAWLVFQGGEEIELNVGNVELNTLVNASENLETVIPGEMIIESSSFSRASDAEKCYVRAVLNYYSKAPALTRQEQNYLLALNAYDYSSNISTGVEGYKWLDLHDGYYYLVDSNNELVVLNNTTTYNFAGNVIFPSLHEVEAEGLEISEGVPQLYLEVKFQAIQSEYLPSSDVDYIVSMFNISFKTKVNSEHLVRFNTGSDLIIDLQVVKSGNKIIEPTIEDNTITVTWYSDSAYTIPFDFDSEITGSITLYAKWSEDEPVSEYDGFVFMDGTLLTYLGNSERVVVPATYSETGERIKYIKTAKNMYEMAVYLYEIICPIDLGYNLYPLVIENEYTIITFNNSEEVEFDPMTLSYPATISYYINKYEAGTAEVTTIGEFALGSIARQIMQEANLDYIPSHDIKEIVIPEGVTTISEFAMAHQILNSLTLPNTLNSIGSNAFYKTTIMSLIIPENVTTIESTAFEGSTIFEYMNLSNVGVSGTVFNEAVEFTDISQSDLYKYETEDYILYAFHDDWDGVSIMVGATTLSDNIILPDGSITLYNVYDSSRTLVLDNHGVFNTTFMMNDNIKQISFGSTSYAFMEAAFAGCTKLELIEFNTPKIYEAGNNLFAACGNLKYVLIQDDAELIALFGGQPIYILQSSGYDGITFTSVEGLVDVAIGRDSDGAKWVRTGNSSGNYKYYIKYEIDFGFSQGLIIVDGMVTSYIGSDIRVVIPQTYSLISTKVKSTVMGFLSGNPTFPATLYAPDSTFTFNDLDTFLMAAMSYMEKGYAEEDILLWPMEFMGEMAGPGNDYTVTGINDGAFASSTLVSVVIPSTVTYIDVYAFNGAPRLIEVVNKSSAHFTTLYGEHVITSESDSKIVQVGDYLFYNGGADDVYLIAYVGYDSEIVLPSSFNNGGYKIYDFALIPNFGDEDYPMVTSITVPECVTGIGIGSFEMNLYLEEFIFNATNCGDLPIDIDAPAFVSSGMYGFNVTIGANVRRIPANLFYSSTVTKVNIPVNSSLVEFGEHSFYNCDRLYSITIPSGVTTIGNEAFYLSYSLLEVINLSSLNIMCEATTHGYVAYYALSVEKTNNSKVVFTDDGLVYYVGGTYMTFLVKYIGKATSLELPSNISGYQYSILKEAFYYNTQLVNVSIPNGVIEIMESAFEGCSKLRTITIPETIEHIGDKAFAFCYSVTDIYYNAINLPDFSDGTYIFQDVGAKNRLDGVNVYIGANVTRIPSYLFYVLDDIDDSDDVDTYTPFTIRSLIFTEGGVCSSIGYYAFKLDNYDSYGSNEIRSIKFSYTIANVDTAAFDNDTKTSASVLCENSTIVNFVNGLGFSVIYLRDTTTDFSTITFSVSYSSMINGRYSDGINTYVRTGEVGSYKYYKRYVTV